MSRFYQLKEEQEREFIFPSDGHLNEAGHEILADVLYSVISKRLGVENKKSYENYLGKSPRHIFSFGGL